MSVYMCDLYTPIQYTPMEIMIISERSPERSKAFSRGSQFNAIVWDNQETVMKFMQGPKCLWPNARVASVWYVTFK